MLYQITDGTVSLGGETILSHFNFEIKGTEKIAVVGRNGAGKTTLLRLIAGEVDLDRDDKRTENGIRMENGIRSSRRVSIGMLRQSSQNDLGKTVEELLLESCPEKETYGKERFAYEMEYDRLFTGFGFEKQEKKRKLAEFSGGEQTKIELIRLLLMKPDILLLDEPTNHLDIQTVEWLEQYMRRYEKAVVFVSHDRFFLDRVVDVVYELQQGGLKRYSGNYTRYREQKCKDIVIQRKAYERQQAEIKRLNELIEQFRHKPKKAAFARSRRSILERMEKVEKPQEDEVSVFTGPLEPAFLGSKWVLEAEHLKIGYEKPLLELSLRVRRGQKIGIIGDNGAGKTTFLKTVAGLLTPLSGKCALGEHTMFGYFDQQSGSIQSEKSVIRHFHDLFPAMTEKEARQLLGAYLFGGKDASKKVDVLSGGEKARLVLAEMLTGRPNLLILDEPTNHMDIQAKETLESAFRSYTGTILFVSHDRYFIQQVADAILVFEGEDVLYYPFGYLHYLERKQRSREENPAAALKAEEQAMIAGFQAVPKAEKHRLKEISTEEAYLDWKFRLAAEPMEAAQKKVELLWNQLQQSQESVDAACLKSLGEEKELSADLKSKASGLDIPDQEQMQQEKTHRMQESDRKAEALAQQDQIEKTSAQLAQAWEEWTKCCMKWYDVWENRNSE